MAIDSVPWFVEQPGVPHPSSSARLLAYVATGGQRGVIGAGSLAVLPSAVPGGQVVVRPGTAVIPSNYAGASQESYMVRNRTQTTLPVPASGSSGTKHYAVIVRIDDTGMAGSAPSNPEAYDYARIELMETTLANRVDVRDLDFPAIMLARIDVPASTGTITKAMIHDYRHIAMAREESVIFPRPILGTDPGAALSLTNKRPYPVGEFWPNVGGTYDGGHYRADVPDWATRVQITAHWNSVRIAPGNSWGQFWVAYGDDAASESPTHATQAFQYDAVGAAGVYRTNFIAIDEVELPASMRGRLLDLVLRANVNAAATAGNVSLDGLSGVSLGLRFLERPDTDLQPDMGEPNT